VALGAVAVTAAGELVLALQTGQQAAQILVEAAEELILRQQAVRVGLV